MRYISEFSILPEASSGNGYWVHGNNIYDMTTDIHLDFIRDNSDLFNISKEEMDAIYAKYGERLGSEGKAREEIIKLVAKDGWVRVRHYSKPDYWSIQCDSIKRREHTIENFIYWAIEHKLVTYDSPATILGYDNPEDKLVYDWENGGLKRFLIKEGTFGINSITLKERRERTLSIFSHLIEDDCVFNESSLSRVLQHGKNGFFILSAFKGNATLEENFTNSVKLRQMLKEEKLGFFELIGYWDENVGKKEEEVQIGIRKQALQRMKKNIDKAKDVHTKAEGSEDVSIEISYFIPYTSKIKMTYEEFKEIGRELSIFFNQDAYICYNPELDVIEMRNQDDKLLDTWKGISLTSIAKAYSRMGNNKNRSFMFEGVRRWGTPMSYMAANAMGYILSEDYYFIEQELQQKILNEQVLKESSWSRIIQHIEKGGSFAIISAFSRENDKQRNYALHNKLRKYITEKGYGYIEQNAGYTYKDDITGEDLISQELSFFVPSMSLDEAISIGEEYEQESILFKDDKGFKLVYTKDGEGFHKGQIGMIFKMDKKPDGQITFNPEILKYAFSQLKKGTKNQIGKKFAYIAECIFVKEGRPPVWAEAMAHASRKEMLSVRWKQIA